MTEEQRQLLIKDLCGRLPYGVNILHVKDGIIGVLSTINIYVEGREQKLKCSTPFFGEDNVPIEEFKPYLYPLSSMTNEQMEKIEDILIGHNPYIVFDFLTYGDIVFHQANVSVKAFAELMQLFDKEMLDYRGLIEEGLAIDATNAIMYNKEKQP